jgi:hypothetical protein
MFAESTVREVREVVIPAERFRQVAAYVKDPESAPRPPLVTIDEAEAFASATWPGLIYAIPFARFALLCLVNRLRSEGHK